MKIPEILKNKKGDASIFLAIYLVIIVTLTIIVLCNSLASLLIMTRQQETTLQDYGYTEFAVHRARWLLDRADISPTTGNDYTDPDFDISYQIDADRDDALETDVSETASITVTFATGINEYNYTISSSVNDRTTTSRYSGGFLTWWD